MDWLSAKFMKDLVGILQEPNNVIFRYRANMSLFGCKMILLQQLASCPDLDANDI